MTKAELRRDLRTRREQFVASMSFAQRCAHYVCLTERVMAQLGDARSVAAYLAVGAEIDPCGAIAAAEAAGRTVALPWLADAKGVMCFRQWRVGEPLFPGPFGIKQPAASASEVAPDLILAPLVGFDARMTRLGQGAGLYDRAFAAHPQARRIGLAWSAQECPTLPADAWDVPLHAVATEREYRQPG